MTKRLTEIQLKKLKPKDKPYKVYDNTGLGLYGVLYPTGTFTWKQKFRIEGREYTDTFKPSYPSLSLAAARQQAQNNKVKHAQGINTHKEKAKKKLVTLEDVCWLWLEAFKLEYPKKYEETKKIKIKT